MLRPFPVVARWAAAGLLAGLCWHAAASPLSAQPSLPQDRTAQPTPPAPPPDASPWAKIPDLRPFPRPGLFLMPPSGPGYYTGLDALNGVCKDKAPPYPYRLEFYENDFRYLDTKDGKPVDWLDDLKRIHLGSPCRDDWELSIGGEERFQYKNEIGGANGRLNGLDNNYDLLRTRVYGDLWYRDQFRVYVEYLDAQSFNQDLPPLPTDVDHSDLLNAFIDVKVGEIKDHPVYVRVGRQELLYGSQRLISPLDWANTRRTFEGAKVFWHGENWDVDAFWTRPVLYSPGHFDAADHNQQFAGLFTTYRPAKGQSVDMYYLYQENNIPIRAFFFPGGRGGYDVNTFGARYSGDHAVPARTCCGASPGDLLWDFEGAYQFGEMSNRDINAGMTSTGLGWHFKSVPMQPQVWAYYDYASGSPHRSGPSTFETFNQLYPFGHYYGGFLDEVGNENKHDLNFQGVLYPAKWITLLTQYHVFRLDQARDALYGKPPGFVVDSGGTRLSPTGAAGTNVGQELDTFASFQLDRHSNVTIGYSKLFGGDFLRNTRPGFVSPELFYIQYVLRW